jgi:hypothetical protein
MIILNITSVENITLIAGEIHILEYIANPILESIYCALRV